MAKISTYPLDGDPKLSDKLIGTSVGYSEDGELLNPTYNFSLQQLLDLFLPVIPANNLQGVLDYGNTATQDINLFGKITTTDLEVTNITNLFTAYIADELYIEGVLYDVNNSKGTSGQILTSTGSGVEWITPVTYMPSLQEVLEVGNISDIDIVLTAKITSDELESDVITSNDELHVGGRFFDVNNNAGSSGQILISLGSGVEWQNIPVYTASSPLSINPSTKNITIQKADGTQNGYLSYVDWINFDGKQNALSGTGIVVSNGGTISYITNNSANWTQAYNDSIVSVSVSGTTTKTLTLTQRDGDVITTTWTESGGSSSAITALTGEATATGPGVATVVLNNAAVISKILTGLNISGGSVVSTDTILQAFGKLQNQINGLIGGATYQGTWNASTNTPALTSSIGTNGYYYIVSVAGNTNLNGITDWNVGDWAIFHGTTWQKVDNTDAVVSVNGYTGAVSLVSSDIPEGLTNLYFTNSRARLALSFAAGSGAYNSTTGLITIPTDNSQIANSAGYITSSALAPYLLISTAASTYYPIPTGTTSQYVRGDGSLATFPSIASEAQRLVTEVYNKTGATLTKGTIVYISGGQGNLPSVSKALATSDATSAQTYGVVQNDITNNNNGYVVVAGSLLNLDTQAYPDGTQLYLSGTTAGTWTTIKPQAPIHLVYVGIVVRSHPTQGVVEIKIQNGYELDELHDVYINPATLANGDLLQYNSSNDLWENKSLSAAGIQPIVTLTTVGTSGPATFIGNVLNIPDYTFTPYSFVSPLSESAGVVSISQAGASSDGYLSSTDWNIFNSKAGVALLGPGQIPMGSVTGDLLPSGAFIRFGTELNYLQPSSSLPVNISNFQISDSGAFINVYNGGSNSLTISNYDGSYGFNESIIFTHGGTAVSFNAVTYDWVMASGNILYNPLMTYFKVLYGSIEFKVDFNSSLVTYDGRQLFQDYTTASAFGNSVVPMLGTVGLVNSGIEIGNTSPLGKSFNFYEQSGLLPTSVPSLLSRYDGLSVNSSNSSGDILSLYNYDSSGIVNIRSLGSYLLAGYDPSMGAYNYAGNRISYNQAYQQFIITYFAGDVLVLDWNSQQGILFGKQIPVLNNYSLYGGDIPYVTANGQLNASGLAYSAVGGGTLNYYGGLGFMPSGATTFTSSFAYFRVNNAVSGSVGQLLLYNYLYPWTGVDSIISGNMLWHDAPLSQWGLFNGGIIYDVTSLTFTFNGTIFSNINNGLVIGASLLPNQQPYGTNNSETLIGVRDVNNGSNETGLYLRRGIYCENTVNAILLSIAQPNTSIDLVAKIGFGTRFFISKISIIVDWANLTYTYKIINTNTTNFDNSNSVNINFNFEISGGLFYIKLQNDTGSDIYANINANIL